MLAPPASARDAGNAVLIGAAQAYTFTSARRPRYGFFGLQSSLNDVCHASVV